MTILKDILDLSDSIKEYDGIEALEKIKRGSNRRSSFQMANDSTLIFPVLVSRATSIATANMIAKAIERQGTTSIRLVLAANQIQKYSNLRDIINQYHNNLNLSSNLTTNDILDLSTTLSDIMENANINIDIPIGNIEEQINSDKIKLNISYESENLNESAIEDISFTIDNHLYGVIKSAINENKSNKKYTQSARDYSDIQKGHKDFFDWASKNQLVDNDVKKSNELIPTTFQVNLIYFKDGVQIPMTFMIGVKAKLHLLNSEDIIEHLISKNKDINTFIKLIKTTTREIKFFKDFLFCVDKAKKDALNTSKVSKSSKLWRVLENLSKKNKLKRLIGTKNNAMAISTLVITQEEADYIKSEYNLNLLDERVIAPIMRSYNLMAFVIVDDTQELAHFLYDETSPLYETISYKGLEREGQHKEKQLLNIIGKLSK